jgi:hypothetical protein
VAHWEGVLFANDSCIGDSSETARIASSSVFLAHGTEESEEPGKDETEHRSRVTSKLALRVSASRAPLKRSALSLRDAFAHGVPARHHGAFVR